MPRLIVSSSLRALFAALVLATAVLATTVRAAPFDEPVELRYTGNLLSQPLGEEAVAVKRFTLYALVTGDAESRTLFHVVDEQGGGAWAWPERFGRVTITTDDEGDATVTGTHLPRLLHTFNDVKSPLELALPVFPYAEKVQPGAEWIDGKFAYVVAGPAKVAGRETQRIDVSTNFGRVQSLWVEAGGLVVKSERKLFLGRGDQFELTLELKSAEPVKPGDVATLTHVADDLVALQKSTNRDPSETKPEIGNATLEELGADLEALGSRAKGTALADLVADIVKDVNAQRKRSGDVASLAAKFIGEKAPALDLVGLDGKPITIEAGKPLLVHFWDYRGEPLEEPYGQVGYISFLQGKRAKLGLQIVGVAVHKGADDPAQTTAVKRSIRKLQEFMRLTYPIALDDGTTLTQYGDPRRLGATLPLWVLIDHEGNVATYHTGYYEADANKGLVDLDAAVVGVLKKMRGRE